MKITKRFIKLFCIALLFILTNSCLFKQDPISPRANINDPEYDAGFRIVSYYLSDGLIRNMGPTGSFAQPLLIPGGTGQIYLILNEEYTAPSEYASTYTLPTSNGTWGYGGGRDWGVTHDVTNGSATFLLVYDTDEKTVFVNLTGVPLPAECTLTISMPFLTSKESGDTLENYSIDIAAK